MVQTEQLLLVPDELKAQQALDALGGYVHQAYATALAWLALAADEFLQVEVAEDFARVARGSIELVQVKRTRRPVSLRAKSVRQLIANHWSLAMANKGRLVRSVYLTTAPPAREQASPLPAGETGLEAWNRAATGKVPPPLVALLRNLNLPKDLKTWIAEATPDELQRDLLSRISWRLGAADSGELERRFDEAIIARGGQLQQLPMEARRAGTAVLFKVIKESCSAGSRVLRRADLEGIMRNANLVLVPPDLLRRLQPESPSYSPPLTDRTRDDPAGKLFFFGAADRVAFLGRKAERRKLLSWARKGSELSWTLVTGAGGMGKSRLALEVCHELANDGWHAGFLSPGSALATAERFSAFRPTRPTLIVIDYVSLAAEWAGEVIRTLIDGGVQRPFTSPIRVLLLERTGPASPWWEGFHAGQLSRLLGHASRLDGAKFLDLGGLGRDDRLTLFERIAGRHSEGDRDRILTSLDRIDPRGTPLFTSLAAEATVAGRKIWQFDRDALLNDIFLRERARWERISRDRNDLSRHELGAALATMVGGLVLTKARDHTPSPELPFHADRFNRDLADAITGRPPSDDQFAALEPDILGEWFTLRQLGKQHALDPRPDVLVEAVGSLIETFAQLRYGYAGFRARLAQDFPREAFHSGLYNAPPPGASAPVVATWMAVLANALDDLAPHAPKGWLEDLYASVVVAREGMQANKDVRVSATAFIGVYAAIKVDAGLVSRATELLDRLDWLPGAPEFIDAAHELSRAGYSVGRALVDRGETYRAFSLLERMRTQAEDFRRTPDADWRQMLRYAASLGLAMWQRFREDRDKANREAIERILWTPAYEDREDLATVAAEVLAHSAVDEDIVDLDDALAELQRRSRERRDLPVLAKITADALLYAARDETDDEVGVDRAYRLSSWVKPRMAIELMKETVEEAIHEGLLDGTGSVGPEVLHRLEAIWHGSRKAVIDAGRNPDRDTYVRGKRDAFVRALNEAGDKDWTKEFWARHQSPPN